MADGFRGHPSYSGLASGRLSRTDVNHRQLKACGFARSRETEQRLVAIRVRRRLNGNVNSS